MPPRRLTADSWPTRTGVTALDEDRSPPRSFVQHARASMIRASQLVVCSLRSLASSPIRHAALAANRRSLFTASRPMMAEVWSLTPIPTSGNLDKAERRYSRGKLRVSRLTVPTWLECESFACRRRPPAGKQQCRHHARTGGQAAANYARGLSSANAIDARVQDLSHE